MIQKLDKIHPLLPKMTKFFIVSFTTVFVELFFFWLVDSVIGWHYTAAVVISLVFAMFANWYGSRAFVFKSGFKSIRQELALILFAGLVTLGIQLIVTSITVELVHWPALIGKLISLGVAFFFNFWFRQNYIFNE